MEISKQKIKSMHKTQDNSREVFKNFWVSPKNGWKKLNETLYIKSILIDDKKMLTSHREYHISSKYHHLFLKTKSIILLDKQLCLKQAGQKLKSAPAEDSKGNMLNCGFKK